MKQIAKRYTGSLVLLTILTCVSFQQLFAQTTQDNRQLTRDQTKPITQSQQAAEPLIRNALYESALSAFTGDVKMYRRHVARRTMELNRLVYEGLRELPEEREMLDQNKLDTLDKFFDKMFVDGAAQHASLSRAEMEQRARTQSNGSLVFLNDQEAILQFAGNSLRVVFEDQAWKVDETELSKQFLLKSFPFTAATRAKIEKL